jgi:hypothetical protein
LFLVFALFALVPAFAAGQVTVPLPIGNAPYPTQPVNANAYGVSTLSIDNSTAMRNAITAAAAIGAAVSIPACGTYQFRFPITVGNYSIPNGMKIFAPGGYQCVRFQASSQWQRPTQDALINQTTPTQGVTIEGITFDAAPTQNNAVHAQTPVGLVWFVGAPNDQIILRNDRFTGAYATWAVRIGADSGNMLPTPMASTAGISTPYAVYMFATVPTNVGEIVDTPVFPDPAGPVPSSTATAAPTETPAPTPTPFPVGTNDVLIVFAPSPLPTPSYSPVPYVCSTPAGYCGYNIYAGTTLTTMVLQNASPIPFPTATFIITSLVTPNPSASPGALGSYWSGYGVPTTASRLSGNILELNWSSGGTNGVRAVAEVEGWQDGIIDKNVFRNNPSCDSALEIYVYSYHMTVSNNQFDTNSCRGGDYDVDDSRDIQFVGNQHLMAFPSPSPTASAMIPNFVVRIQNGHAISINDTIEITSSSVGTEAMHITDAVVNDDHPQTLDTRNSSDISIVPHWTLGSTAGGGLLVPSINNTNYKSMMHDIYVKGGWIWINDANASGFAGGVVVDCSETSAAIKNITVQGVDFPTGTMPITAPGPGNQQAPIEFVNAAPMTNCTNMRAFDNTIGLMTNPTNGGSFAALLARGPFGSVIIKGKDLSQWPSLAAAVYLGASLTSSTLPTVSDVGNVIPPGPSNTISPALGFLGITAPNCLQGNANGAFGSAAGPCVVVYQHNGSAGAASLHCVIDKITGGTPSTTVSLTGSAQFTTTNYTVLIQDVTTPAAPLPPYSLTTSSFTFLSTTDTYVYRACGM